MEEDRERIYGYMVSTARGIKQIPVSIWLMGVMSLVVLPASQNDYAVYGEASGQVARKEVSFEVASIRPTSSGYMTGTGVTFNPTPDGFVSALTVWQMLMLAYAPDGQSWGTIPIVNAPKWLGSPELYVVNARVADVDREAWRSQGSHHDLLRSAMRNLLKERCRLMLHEQAAAMPDYKLVVRKSGLRMKATIPGSTPPKGAFPMPSGAYRLAEGPRHTPTWHLYGATMADVVEFLSPAGTGSTTPPVHDETGVSGRYDFSLTRVEDPSRDPEGELYDYPLGPLGLELRPGKYQGFKLVIDHIERPSAND